MEEQKESNSQKKVSEEKSDSEGNSPVQRSSVHRMSLGSVQNLASKFGGQTNATQSQRRNTDINYKVE